MQYIYIGAFLGDADRKKLLEAFPPKHGKVFADHVTLAYRPSEEEAQAFELGKEISFSAIGIGEDAQGQAVAVDLKGAKNEIPHITISVAGDTKPIYSNDLLKRGYAEIKPLKLKGRIGAWNGMKAVFEDERPSPVSKILIPSRPQPDTIVAIFILRTFGSALFPGVEKAPFEVMPLMPKGETFETLLKKGSLAIDMGGGELDHHGKVPEVTCSELIAMKLGVKEVPSLAKLLEYSRRDDIAGKGTVSSDALDKAFGLSGLIAALNKTYPNDGLRVLESVMPLLIAHHEEEKKRTEALPKEFAEAKASGKADIFEVRQRDKKLSVVILESDNMSMPGYLRSQIGGRFDVVAQRTAAGHVNILTRPAKRIDLRSLALIIRLEEANQRGIALDKEPYYLSRSGKIPEVPNWYFDDATNSIQNGGANPRDVEPTTIEPFAMRKLIQAGLSESLWSPMRR